MLGEAEDVEGAVQAYRDGVELGRLSETTEGFEARAKASYNLSLLQNQAQGTCPWTWSPRVAKRCRRSANNRTR